MKKLLVLLVAVFSFSAVFVSCKEETKDKTEKHEMAMSDTYQCPMDCESGKTYKKEGSCPVCKMDLKKVESHSHEHDGDSHEGHNHDSDEKHDENESHEDGDHKHEH